MPSSRSDIQRLERVASMRQTMAGVAEARVKEAENVVRDIQLEDERLVRKIRDTRAEITYRGAMSGRDMQHNEKYIEVLGKVRAGLQQKLEKARVVLAERHQEWIEARREQKIIERLQERRLQEWQHQEEIALQKSVDDSFIGRLVRSREL